jgi:hypothetical protein
VQSSSFYAHHSPWGAYASFCLGFYGRGGGFALSDVHPPDWNVYIGYALRDSWAACCRSSAAPAVERAPPRSWAPTRGTTPIR